MDARRLLRLLLLMVGIMLSAILAPVFLVPVHAAGNLYIDPAGQAAQPAGSIVTYQVKVANMGPFNAWDIQISTTRLSLDPVNVSLASNVVGNPFSELVNCVNGGEGIPNGQPGDIGCNLQDGPGIVHSAADFLNSSPSGTNGLLFTINFKAGSQDYSQIRFLDAIIVGGGVGAGTAIIHTSIDGSYGTLPGGIPTAEFSWLPAHPVAGDKISFNASLSHDDPSNSPSVIQTYLWDFGDRFSTPIATASPYVDHTYLGGYYPAIGNFTVTLTVTNSFGLVNAINHLVEIRTPPKPCKQGLSSILVPQDCPSISSAIDSVVPGGTIRITAGSYNESLIINKSLTLTGAGRDLTILRGEIESRAAK